MLLREAYAQSHVICILCIGTAFCHSHCYNDPRASFMASCSFNMPCTADAAQTAEQRKTNQAAWKNLTGLMCTCSKQQAARVSCTLDAALSTSTSHNTSMRPTLWTAAPHDIQLIQGVPAKALVIASLQAGVGGQQGLLLVVVLAAARRRRIGGGLGRGGSNHVGATLAGLGGGRSTGSGACRKQQQKHMPGGQVVDAFARPGTWPCVNLLCPLASQSKQLRIRHRHCCPPTLGAALAMQLTLKASLPDDSLAAQAEDTLSFTLCSLVAASALAAAVATPLPPNTADSAAA